MALPYCTVPRKPLAKQMTQKGNVSQQNESFQSRRSPLYYVTLHRPFSMHIFTFTVDLDTAINVFGFVIFFIAFNTRTKGILVLF